MTKRVKAIALVVAFAAGAFALNEASGVQARASLHTAHIQTTSATRFKRGIKRTTKKIRHFIHRASGKH